MLLTDTVRKDLSEVEFEEYQFPNKYENNRVDTLKLSEAMRGGGFSINWKNFTELNEELSAENPDTAKIRELISSEPLKGRNDVIQENLKIILDASYDREIGIVMPSWDDLLIGYVPKYGDYLSRFLHILGIRDIYGVPGGASEALSDSFARHADLFQSVLTSHEATSAYLAALNKVKTTVVSGKNIEHQELDIGVCFTTTRPGIRNLLPGIDYAYVSKRSFVAITAASMPATLGKKAFQETDADILAMFDSVTCYNTTITDPGQVIPKLHTAFWESILHREPAHINVSSHILNMPVSLLNPIIMPKCNIPRKPLKRTYSEEVNNRGVEILRNFLMMRDNPLLYLSLGSRYDLQEFLKFSEALNVPFVTSPEGRDIVGSHPLYCGSLGMAGHVSATDAVAKSDLVVGVNPGAGQFSGVEKLRHKTFVHIAAYPDNFGVTADIADGQILGNPGTIFRKARKYLVEHGITFHGENYVKPYYIEYESSVGKDEPVHFADAILFWRENTPKTTNFFYDIGTSMLAGIHWDRPEKSGTSRAETKDGAMTVGIYEALGKSIELKRDVIEEALAAGEFAGLEMEEQRKKERELKTGLVICFTGDGATLMSSNEFVTARRLGLNILFIIPNNKHLQMVNQGQSESGKEIFCSDLTPDGKPVDFSKIAEGSSVKGYKIKKYDDFKKLPLDYIVHNQGPKVIDMETSQASMPMTQRLIQLKTD